jgi:hypothetical protein
MAGGASPLLLKKMYTIEFSRFALLQIEVLACLQFSFLFSPFFIRAGACFLLFDVCSVLWVCAHFLLWLWLSFNRVRKRSLLPQKTKQGKTALLPLCCRSPEAFVLQWVLCKLIAV